MSLPKKFSPEQIKAIRTLKKTRSTQNIAKQYNVSTAVIKGILERKPSKQEISQPINNSLN